MAFETNDLSGALFTNDQKGNDKAPRYTGTCKIAGKEWRMAAWLKEDRNGKKYMSLAFSEPQGQRDTGEAYKDASKGGEGSGPAKSGTHSSDPLESDDIPFKWVDI